MIVGNVKHYGNSETPILNTPNSLGVIHLDMNNQDLKTQHTTTPVSWTANMLYKDSSKKISGSRVAINWWPIHPLS